MSEGGKSGMKKMLSLALLLAGCSGNASQTIQDPIPDVPLAQQRSVGRSDFRPRWPFTVGVGTLGCTSGAVLFRHGGLTYALNDAAASRGFGSVDPIRVSQSGPPSNPLGRLKQEHRMQIFAAAAVCGTQSCAQQLRETHGISEAELKQIDVEGRERFWPPLSPRRMTLEPVVEAGLKLCQG
jgi:hypothetical protein